VFAFGFRLYGVFVGRVTDAAGHGFQLIPWQKIIIGGFEILNKKSTLPLRESLETF
jgi:hypothetical protein